MTLTILFISLFAIPVLMTIVDKASHNSLGGQWVIFALYVCFWVILGYAYCHEDDLNNELNKKEAPQIEVECGGHPIAAHDIRWEDDFYYNDADQPVSCKTNEILK